MVSRHQGQRLTYAELDAASTALARGLRRQGVARGARVAVSLGNSVEYAVTSYALFKLGAVLVPLNPGFAPAQVVAAMRHLAATHLVVSAETNLPRRAAYANDELVRGVRAGVATLQGVVVVDNAGGRGAVDGVRYEDVAADGRACADALDTLDPDDVVNIQFTSGTTSTPKAACLTHRNVLNNGLAIGDRMLLTHADVVCSPPPMFQ